MINISNEYGVVEYTDTTIASIIGLSATQSYGVVGMAYKNASDGIWQVIKRQDKFIKGVKLSVEEDKLIIDLYIIVQYGTKISEIANNIISQLKYNIEHLTGIKVGKITVNVQDIRY